MAQRIKSALVVAKLLHAEGFTDHTASVIRRYALRCATPNQRKRYRRIKAEFSRMVSEKLSSAERLLMGKMIGYMIHMHFDTGLRIGLAAMAVENGKSVELQEP